jgi:hypothetical protein
MKKYKNKIIVRVAGGVGNQLFMYAAARSLSLRNNLELVIDDVTGFMYDFKFKRTYQLNRFEIHGRKATSFENLTFFPIIHRLLIKAISRFFPKYSKLIYVQQIVWDYDSSLLDEKTGKNIYLDGYWQSENYFIEYEDQIRQDLKINPPSDIKNITMAEKIKSVVAVAVHVRFFELPGETGMYNNASPDYYTRAIEKMEELVSDAHYYVFSDQPIEARKRINFPHNRVTFVCHNNDYESSYLDLWLMTMCSHFIIANSTFSWWGAWLSVSDNKKVIAPGFTMVKGSAWGFKGLLPNEWIKL